MNSVHISGQYYREFKVLSCNLQVRISFEKIVGKKYTNYLCGCLPVVMPNSQESKWARQLLAVGKYRGPQSKLGTEIWTEINNGIKFNNSEVIPSFKQFAADELGSDA